MEKTAFYVFTHMLERLKGREEATDVAEGPKMGALILMFLHAPLQGLMTHFQLTEYGKK